MKTFCWGCDNKGWVCEKHPLTPAPLFSDRFDACKCGAPAERCSFCDTSGEVSDDAARTYAMA